MIYRHAQAQIAELLQSFPAVAVLGARQVGKTTLAYNLAEVYPNACILDMERPSDAAKLDEAELDVAVERLLSIVFRSAETEKGHKTLDVDAHHTLARRIAGEAIVLLKNEDDLLPLQNVRKIAVIGRSAKSGIKMET